MPAHKRLARLFLEGTLRLSCMGCMLALGVHAGPGTRYEFHSWQSDEGLPHNSVHALAQTPDGYLWVGTQNGLVRFDGVRFVRMGGILPPIQEGRRINTLLAGSDGTLWIGTEGAGLLRWGGNRPTPTEAGGLPSNNITSLLETRQGDLWIGTDRGPARLRTGVLKRFDWSGGLGEVPVAAMAEDGQGRVRMATPRGLLTVTADGVLDPDNGGIGPIAYALRTVYADGKGKLWFGGSGGLRFVNLGETKPEVRITDLLQQVISTVVLDQTGHHWIGTLRGIVQMRDGRVLDWPLNAGAAGDSIFVVFEDREQNLWVGGRDGLYRLRPARFTTFGEREGLAGNQIRAVCETEPGVIWAASMLQGLNRLGPNGVTRVTQSNGLSGDAVLSLLPDRQGRLWVGMDWGRGLDRLSPERTNQLGPIKGLINAPIRVMVQDKHDALWIGTGKGLNIWRDGVPETATIAEGWENYNITDLLAGPGGEIWIGSDRGLGRWDGAEFLRYTRAQGLSDNAVTCLHLDEDGMLWVGTRSQGLNRLQDGRIASYTKAQGLFSDEILDLVEDDFGFLWVTCRQGLFRIRKSEFDALDKGTKQRLECVAFGRSDGLATVQFSAEGKPTAIKAADGRLWFATVRGVIALDPGVRVNELAPTVVIEEVMADGKVLQGAVWKRPTTGDKTVQVPAGTRTLDIHYTALSLRAPERNQFRHRLSGVEDAWVEADHRRVAHYNLLRPGKYRFEVLASNNDGVWSRDGDGVLIYLRPYIWQTWWFKALVTGLAALLLAGFYRMRVNRLRDLERLRLQIASNLHDDVGSRLTRVAMVTEQAKSRMGDDAPGTAYLKDIADNLREIVGAMDEIVWTINPRNDTVEHLANYIFQHAQDYFQHTPVRCRLDVPAELPNPALSTGQRHNLFMAVKEALNNVLKHSGATEARIRIDIKDGLLAIEISDNGCGIDPAATPRGGNGLTNLHDRLERIGGRLHLSTPPGGGTTVTLETRLS